MANHTEPFPLRSELQSEAKRLRALKPSPGFARRLHAALARAETMAPVPPPRRPAYPIAALVLATAAILVLAYRDTCRDTPSPPRYHLSTAAIDVLLDNADSAWVHVDLHTHYHNGQNTVVHVEAPHSVAVMPGSDMDRAAGMTPTCDATTCVYRFEHAHMSREPLPLTLGVRDPGHHLVRVVHMSQDAHVHQEFAVRARPLPNPRL